MRCPFRAGFPPTPDLVALGNRFNDRQTQARALALLGFFLTAAVELLENARDDPPGRSRCRYRLTLKTIWSLSGSTRTVTLPRGSV